MKKFRVLAQSMTSSKRISREFIAKDEATVLLLASTELEGTDYYVSSITCVVA